MISAECHSDDRLVEVAFDATLWFKQADDKELTDLALCEFSCDYPADVVAIFMGESNPEIVDMFKHIEIMSRRETMGFECKVKTDEAMAWIKRNRAHLIEEWKSNDFVGMGL